MSGKLKSVGKVEGDFIHYRLNRPQGGYFSKEDCHYKDSSNMPVTPTKGYSCTGNYCVSKCQGNVLMKTNTPRNSRC